MTNCYKFALFYFILAISVIHGYPSGNNAVEYIVKSLEIVNALAESTTAERQEMVRSYKMQHNRDFLDDVKSEFTGQIRSVIVAMLTPPYNYHGDGDDDVKILVKTLQIIKALAESTQAERVAMLKHYKIKHKMDLVDDVKIIFSGTVRDIIIAMLNDR